MVTFSKVYGPSGAVRSVSGNGNTASYFYHPQKRTLENVIYTKEGEAGPMLQSMRKHDAANRLTRITAHVNDAGVQKPIDQHAYDYDALDHLQKNTGITGAFWKYGYNATGEVTGATRKMPDATTDYFGRNYRYYYDGIGNRTSVEQSRNGAQASRLFSYTPNALNQYSAITHPDFVDVSGTANPLAAVTVNGIAAARQSDYFYKELSEDNSAGPQWIDATITDGTTTTNGSLSLPAAATTPVHDDDGNLTSDGEWLYNWDAENRLIGIERSAAALAAGAPYHREKHDYDHRNRRIRTTIFTNSGTTLSSQTLYIFDGWKCIAELTGIGQHIRKYTWGLDLANRLADASTGNVGALLWLVDGASNKTHIHLYDENGNVTGLVDTTTRKRSASYEYDAFGLLFTCYGDYAKSNPFTFSTKFTDYATGLRYYGYKWYEARDGRWISIDPTHERGGINLYGFVFNDANNLVDRLGWEPQAPSLDGTGKWHQAPGNGGGGRFITQPSLNIDPSNSLPTGAATRDEAASKSGNVASAVASAPQLAVEASSWLSLKISNTTAASECTKKANLIYTKGTGATTKCPLCCQVKLQASPEGLYTFIATKMFYGTCDENERSRTFYLSQPQFRNLGTPFYYSIKYFY